MGAQEGSHHCQAMLLCRAVGVLACWACPLISQTAISRSKVNLFFFAVCSFEHLCGVLKFCQVHYPEGRYPPLYKSASRSTLGVDMKSLEDSMDCATEFACRHLQDVSCVGVDDIVVGPVVVVIEGMPLVSSCH